GIRAFHVTGVQTCALPISGALDPMQILIARAVVRGHCVGPRSSFEAMNAFMQRFDVHPAIDSVFAWADAARALAALQAQHHVGRSEERRVGKPWGSGAEMC